MKFRVTMKDPDGLSCSLKDLDVTGDLANLELAERAAVGQMRREAFRSFAVKWLEYGEYVVLEFDTTDGTCVVVKP